MKLIYDEIQQIPLRAQDCYENNKGIMLPRGVPYLGMGASYYACLTLYYCQAPFVPYIASEYYHYFSSAILPLGVLVSRSGESSEILWNLERFKKVVAITNTPISTLATSEKTKETILLHAGLEKFSTATKTYVNTLIAMYLGFGIGCEKVIAHLAASFSEFGEEQKENARNTYSYIKRRKHNGLYIIGSGPNIGTAMEGALALSETTKLSWIGLPLGMFDHGPKEALRDSVVIFLDTKGQDERRQEYLEKLMKKKSNACIFKISEKELPEILTPLSLILQIFLYLNYLCDYLGMGSKKWIGSKVTRVAERLK